MVDPVPALDQLLRPVVQDVLGREHDPMVRRSEHADLQADLAQRLARPLGTTPAELARRIAAAIPPSELVEDVTVAPAGFLNFRLRDAWLAGAAGRMAADEDRLGVPPAEARERVVIDYSSANIAKELHVGHLRSTVIGDALARVLAWRGHAVIRQNHLGDWGRPFGMLIEHMIDVGEDRARGELRELTAFYRAANQRLDREPAFAERVRRRVVLLQRGDAQTRAWWQELVALSTRYMEDVYRRLGARLEPADVRGESWFNDRLAPLADELERLGHARETEGALGVFPAGFANRQGQPLPLLVRNRDGGFGYAATDLAAIRYRRGELGATRLIYVVGGTQAQHLAMVFAVADQLGWLDGGRAEHVGFGLVLGCDGRRLQSRDGDPPRLVELMDCAIEAADAEIERLEAGKRERGLPLLPPGVRAEVARMVGIGSIKYADLGADRRKDYIYDLARMVRFEGRTAGYAQYAHARIRSVLNKAGDAARGPIRISAPEERALIFALTRLGAVVAHVDATLEPHHLTAYVHDLAATFTAFYDACPILRSSVPAEVRASRLALAELTARAIARSLDLLGIEAPEQM